MHVFCLPSLYMMHLASTVGILQFCFCRRAIFRLPYLEIRKTQNLTLLHLAPLAHRKLGTAQKTDSVVGVMMTSKGSCVAAQLDDIADEAKEFTFLSMNKEVSCTSGNKHRCSCLNLNVLLDAIPQTAAVSILSGRRETSFTFSQG